MVPFLRSIVCVVQVVRRSTLLYCLYQIVLDSERSVISILAHYYCDEVRNLCLVWCLHVDVYTRKEKALRGVSVNPTECCEVMRVASYYFRCRFNKVIFMAYLRDNCDVSYFERTVICRLTIEESTCLNIFPRVFGHQGLKLRDAFQWDDYARQSVLLWFQRLRSCSDSLSIRKSVGVDCRGHTFTTSTCIGTLRRYVTALHVLLDNTRLKVTVRW